MVQWNEATQRKIDANRRNAEKSTGPKTAEGKDRSKRNHTSHGFFCADLVLPGEDPWRFHYLREALIDDHKPQNHAELMIVDRIVVAQWKLNRLQRSEAIMHQNVENRRKDFAKAWLEFHETRLSNFAGDKKVKPTQHMKEMVQFSREFLEQDHGECGDIAYSLACDMCYSGVGGNGESRFDRLHRYEQRLENSIHRAINQLRKMRKDAKENEDLPPSPFSRREMDSLEDRYAAMADSMEKTTGRRPPPFEEIERRAEEKLRALDEDDDDSMPTAESDETGDAPAPPAPAAAPPASAPADAPDPRAFDAECPKMPDFAPSDAKMRNEPTGAWRRAADSPAEGSDSVRPSP
jgi:hypothetical protein